MKFITNSWHLPSVYKAGSCQATTMTLLMLLTQWIVTEYYIVFPNSLFWLGICCLAKIYCQLGKAICHYYSHLFNHVCTFLKSLFNPPNSNQLGIVTYVKRQLCWNICQNNCNNHSAGEQSFLMLFQTVFWTDNAPKLNLQRFSHTDFLPLIQDSTVELPLQFRKFFEVEFDCLPNDWEFAFDTISISNLPRWWFWGHVEVEIKTFPNLWSRL